MRPVAAAVLALMALSSALADAGVARVWAVSDGEKIEQDNLASPLRARNSAWDGKTVHLFGARNEVLAFQVMVQSDDRGIQALTASLPELRQRSGPGRITYAAPAGDPIGIGYVGSGYSGVGRRSDTGRSDVAAIVRRRARWRACGGLRW